MSLSLKCFGDFQATWDNQPLAFATNSSRALLAYLAVHADQAHTREKLSALLWPDQTQATAFANLRSTLARVRKALPNESQALHITQQTVQFRRGAGTVDVHEFEMLLAQCAQHAHISNLRCAECAQRRTQAAALYSGELLQHLSLRASQPFEEWLLVKREQLHGHILVALNALTLHHEQAKQFDVMQRYAAQQLALNPWAEEAHAQLMRVWLYKGDRTAALTQYETCSRILKAELGIQPGRELRELRDRIRANEVLFAVAPAQPTPAPPKPQELGHAPEPVAFYGREAELSQLTQWVLQEGCRLVAVLGMGGLGKTALAAKLVRNIGAQFDGVFWQSLLNAPALSDVLRNAVQTLAGQPLLAWPDSLDEQLALLLSQLRAKKCLLVLDNAESILHSEAQATPGYRAGYEPYDQLFHWAAQQMHQSCVLLTSRVRPPGLARLTEAAPMLQTLRLQGLQPDTARAVLAAHGLTGEERDTRILTERYSGNPLALKLVAETVNDLFDGDIAHFLQERALVFDDIRAVLDEQFARLSPREQEILTELAIAREPVTLQTLSQTLPTASASRDIIEALRTLQRHSLLEQVKTTGTTAFALQNVVMEYVTERLIAEVGDELIGGPLRHLQDHALMKTEAKEYVRQSQLHLVVQPIATALSRRLGRAAAIETLKQGVARLRPLPTHTPGYAAGNLLNLLIALEADLTGMDFSGLCVWQAYLRGVALRNVNFANADLRGCAFTDSFHAVTAMAYSPDGSVLAAATRTAIRLWRTADWQPSGELSGHDGGTLALAFSPDGQWLLSGGDDHVMRLWEANGTRLVRIFEGHSHSVRAVAFSPDQKRLASGSGDNTVRVWDATTGQLLHDLREHTRVVSSVAFSPDGQTLASGSWDRTIRLWDVNTGEPLRMLRGHERGVTRIAFHPHGQWIASGSWDRTVRVWEVGQEDLGQENLGHEQRVYCLSGHARATRVVTFSPDGTLLASGDEGGVLRLWDARDGRALHVLSGHVSSLEGIAFSPDGAHLASGGLDQTVRIWDTHSGRALHTLNGYTHQVKTVAFNADSTQLISGGDGAVAEVWDVTTGQVVRHLRGHTDVISEVAFSGSLMVTSSWDQTLRVWDAETPQARHVLRGHLDDINGFVLSPNGRLVASVSDDHSVRLWEMATGRMVHVLEAHPDAVQAVAFNADGRLLASFGSNQTLHVWDVTSGHLLRTFHAGQGYALTMVALSFRGDGQSPELRLAASDNERVRVLQVESGQDLFVCEGHAARIANVAFSPNGKRLATADQTGEVRVWDIAHPNQAQRHSLHTLRGHTRVVEGLAFNRTGDLLASGGYDGTIRVWRMSNGECVRVLSAQGLYAGMNLAQATNLSDAQRTALKLLGATSMSNEVTTY